MSSIKCNDMPSQKDQNEAYLFGINTMPVKKNEKPDFITISMF